MVIEDYIARIDRAFGTLRERLADYRPDVLIIIGGDQSEMFDRSNVPNLMIYVPPRSLLTGEATGVALGEYLLLAAAQATAWSVGLLAVASLVFRRRDFL